MKIERAEANNRMSHITIHNGVVYLAGQIGEGDTVQAQTESTLAKIDRLLALAGSSKEHILSAQVWLKDIGAFDEMNKAWDAWVAQGNAPTRVTGESKLARPHYLVEITVVAAVKG